MTRAGLSMIGQNVGHILLVRGHCFVFMLVFAEKEIDAKGLRATPKGEEREKKHN